MLPISPSNFCVSSLTPFSVNVTFTGQLCWKRWPASLGWLPECFAIWSAKNKYFILKYSIFIFPEHFAGCNVTMDGWKNYCMKQRMSECIWWFGCQSHNQPFLNDSLSFWPKAFSSTLTCSIICSSQGQRIDLWAFYKGK